MKTFKRYFLKLLCITSSMLILSAPLVYLQIYHPQQAHSVSGFMKENFWGFTAFRILLIAGFFAMWPAVVRHFAQKYGWTEAKAHFWLMQRFRLTAWLIVFELLVCQNILFHIFR